MAIKLNYSYQLCGYTASDATNVVFVSVCFLNQGLLNIEISASSHNFLTSFSREDCISQKPVLQLCPVILHTIFSWFHSQVHVAGAMRVKFLAQGNNSSS